MTLDEDEILAFLKPLRQEMIEYSQRGDHVLLFEWTKGERGVLHVTYSWERPHKPQYFFEASYTSTGKDRHEIFLEIVKKEDIIRHFEALKAYVKERVALGDKPRDEFTVDEEDQ
jgi:hypothetical protein